MLLSCPHQIGCLVPVALHGKSMKKEQKKLLCQLSAELTVCTGEVKQLCFAISISDELCELTHVFVLDSKHICLWANEQRKDLHNDGNY